MKATAMQVTSETEAMSHIYDKEANAIDDFVNAFPTQSDQVGALFFIGGVVAGMDVFDHPSVLRKLLPKLIRSYALDAIEVESKTAASISVKSTEQFLAKVARSDVLVLPAVGLGADHRFDNEGLSGGALIIDDQVIHLAAFSI